MSDENDDEENEIIVVADRPSDVDGGGGGGFGWWGWGNDFFDFNPPGMGGGGGGGAPPPDDTDPDETPEIIVEAPRPSEGQEDFADDGDPFNDGEAPTRATVDAWIAQMLAEGVTDQVIITVPGDNPDSYEGSYVDIGGNRYEFGSDGQGGYYLFTFPATPPPPPPVDPNDIALGPSGPTFDDGNDYYLL